MKCKLVNRCPMQITETDFDRMLFSYATHDWSWDFSDDISERQEGRRQYFKMVELEKEIDTATKLSALIWAFQMKSMPAESYQIRHKLFVGQLTQAQEARYNKESIEECLNRR